MKTVLLVDDEPDFVELTKMRLEGNGYKVLTASNGQEGLDVARSQKPDLILLDVMMPDMDGYQMLKKVRVDPEIRSTPVVMLTAKGETRSMLKAKEMGSTDYLIKPCEPEELMKWVRRYAGQ
jgi:DNA-binding response OmpR family regulator